VWQVAKYAYALNQHAAHRVPDGVSAEELSAKDWRPKFFSEPERGTRSST
jgi:hypothetical protein